MGHIPNGIQQHYLWQMDGRTWIEVSVRSESKLRDIAIAKGYCKPIPHELIVNVVNEVNK